VPELFQAQAAKEGIDLAPHRSAWLDRETASEASLIVLFDRVNQSAFAERYPSFEVRTILLGDLIGVGEIQDPVDGDATVAALSYERIREGVTILAQVLCKCHR
jgi:protein-tyrosine-phosphatase